MNVRMGLIRRQSGWSLDEFSTYWRDKHGPLAARVPNLREYWQNLVTDRLQRGIEFARGPWDFDGVSQLSFDEVRQADHAFREGELAAALIEDERRFLGGLHILTAQRMTVVPVPAQRRCALLKRIWTLRRRPGIGEEDYRREWRFHAEHVRRMPGVSGYCQNVVLSMELTKGQSCAYEQMPTDGIVELWFEDASAIEATFASPAGRSTMSHARTFLHEITAFLVEERRIV